MGEIVIAYLEEGELEEAAELASRAFIPTPLVKAVMIGDGEKQRKGLQKGMKQLLGHATGTWTPSAFFQICKGRELVVPC